MIPGTRVVETAKVKTFTHGTLGETCGSVVIESAEVLEYKASIATSGGLKSRTFRGVVCPRCDKLSGFEVVP